jgi:hypothetical protein
MILRDAPEFPNRPFFASCNCGPQGNFVTKEQALEFLKVHAGNQLGGLNTVEFSDLTGQPATSGHPGPIPPSAPEEPEKEQPETEEVPGEEKETPKEEEGKVRVMRKRKAAN